MYVVTSAKVLYLSALPAGLSLLTKTSLLPAFACWIGSGVVGKSVEAEKPVM
jgi:hypothetical protein